MKSASIKLFPATSAIVIGPPSTEQVPRSLCIEFKINRTLLRAECPQERSVSKQEPRLKCAVARDLKRRV